MIVRRTGAEDAVHVSFADGERVGLRTFLDDDAYAAAFADAFVRHVTIDFTGAGPVAPEAIGALVLAKRMQAAKRGTLRVVGLSGPALERARAYGITYVEDGGQGNGEENGEEASG